MKRTNLIQKTVLLTMLAILVTAFIPVITAGAEETIIASFEVKLPEDTTTWVNQGIVYLHKKGVNALTTKNNSDALAIKFWSGNGTTLRVGISEPSITNTLQTRKDFLVEDVIDSLMLKIKIIKQTDGKFKMFVNDVSINDVNWLSQIVPDGYTQVTWKETDDLLRTSDLSKIPADNAAYVAGDNAKIDFLMNLPDAVEMTLDASSMLFKVQNVVLLGSKTSSTSSSKQSAASTVSTASNTASAVDSESISNDTSSLDNSSISDSSADNSTASDSTDKESPFTPVVIIAGAGILLAIILGIALFIVKRVKK
jgi:hypothetical protein